MRDAKTVTYEKAIRWTDNCYIVFGLMKLILIAFFFASFAVIEASKADAQTDASCKGRNLLEVLETEQSEAYATVLKAEAEALNADAVFWKVERQGHEPSWLLGPLPYTRLLPINRCR